MEKTEKNEKREPEKKSEIRKVSISQDAEEALNNMVDETNKGFQGGKVSKAELLSWLVLHFEKHSFSSVREDIRKAYFDKIAYLSSVVNELKKAQRDGMSGLDLESLLAPITTKSS